MLTPLNLMIFLRRSIFPLQLINGSTHVKGDTLDVFIVNTDSVNPININSTYYLLSDHLPITFDLQGNYPKIEFSSFSFRMFSHIDQNTFISDIDNSLIHTPSGSFKDAVSYHEEQLGIVFDIIMPLFCLKRSGLFLKLLGLIMTTIKKIAKNAGGLRKDGGKLFLKVTN